MDSTFTNIKKSFIFLIIGQIGMIISSIVDIFTPLNEITLLISLIITIVASCVAVVGYGIAQKDKESHFFLSFWLSIVYSVTLIAMTILLYTGVITQSTPVNTFRFISAIIGIFVTLDVVLGCMAVAPELTDLFRASFWGLVLILFLSIFIRWLFPIIITEDGVTSTWVFASAALFAFGEIWFLVILCQTRKALLQ